jgi:hypothetical protein
LESLKGVRARIQETGAAELREVLVTELRGLPALPITQLDQRLEKLASNAKASSLGITRRNINVARSNDRRATLPPMSRRPSPDPSRYSPLKEAGATRKTGV